VVLRSSVAGARPLRLLGPLLCFATGSSARSNRQAQGLVEEEMELATLIAPCSVSELREKFWNQASAYFPGRPERFADLAFDFEALCRQLHMERDPGVKAQFVDPLGRHQELPIAASQIQKCFAAGMTICFADLEAALPALAA